MTAIVKDKKILLKECLLCIFGGVGYAVILNIFIQPFHFVSGSITGIAQLLTFSLHSLSILPKSVNLTGIFLMLVNIPLLFLARSMASKIFIYKTIATSIFSTIAYTVIPVPATSPIEDPLTACLIAGILGGLTSGLTLRGGGSGGGLDIIGLYLSHKSPKFSVGKVAIGVSLFVYLAAFFRFDFNITIYSIIFTVISSAVVDRIHYQNIKVAAWIVTSNEDVKEIIINDLNRTATTWEGQGMFSKEQKHIFLTVITKYEVVRMRRLIRQVDPSAFVLIADSSDVIGNFQFRID
ncbi:MAG TPA: YitT family protein [Clostridiaceae bacterium]|nr:YitT family protein [Clostridiaceae bacterium]